MKRNIILMTVLAAVLIYSSCATSGTGRIPASVARYIASNGADISSYPISSIDSSKEFLKHERMYDVYADAETVWLDYRKTEPRKAFEGKIIDFGVVFNPDDSIVYTQQDRTFPHFAEGQIYILNLKFMGIYSFPVAFKVTKIDSEKKMIEFIYMQENISNGFQQIYFEPSRDAAGKPVTHIRHLSFFKSAVGLSDRFIYPSFHQKTIDDFHENIFRLNQLNWSTP